VGRGNSSSSRLWIGIFLWGCEPSTGELPPTGGGDPFGEESSDDSGNMDSGRPDTGTNTVDSADTGSVPCEPPDYGSPGNPFADIIVEFSPGEGAGFGQDRLPDVVLGPPLGGGPSTGSDDVLTLGEGGHIILEFTDRALVDGDGVDLLVFENPFPGWAEPGVVGVSEDGETWVEWSCNIDDDAYTGCAGIEPVLTHPDNCIDATNPAQAGGDGFDLADIGVERARFIRIRDAATTGPGGFDLDAVSVVHGEVLER
jgi:hypothetical protein